MIAVILAAGRGSRMGVACDRRPKCLLEVAKKPLIMRQIAALRGAGAHTVGIVRGYRSEMICFPGVSYFDNPRWKETNMVMSLATAADWLWLEPIIVSYGDIFYRRDLAANLWAADGDLVVAYDTAWRNLWSRRFVDPLTDAETFRTDDSGNLIEIGGKATKIANINGQFMGLLKFTPNAWLAVDDILSEVDTNVRDQLDMTRLLRILLARNFPIRTLATSGNWGEVDSPEDLALYESMINKGELLLDE
jgi:choline kinase